MRAQIWLFLTISVAFVQTRLDGQTLDGISPSAATAGGAGFQMTASGTFFTNGAAIQWNGSSLSTTYVDSFTLSAYVPASLIASPGTAAVTVLNSGRQLGPLAFHIVSSQGPIITGFSPQNASPGRSLPLTIDISGNGFVSGSIAQWGGTALPTTFVSAVHLTATVAPSLTTSAGSYNITVVNPGGATSPPAVFVLSTGGLTFGVIPTTKAAGGPDFTLIVMSGNGAQFPFYPGFVVQWNGSPLVTTYTNGNTMSAAVPASLIASAGTATITISGSYAYLPVTFQVIADTLISGVSPTSAAAGGPAFSLTVKGVGFVPGSTVLWNGSSLGTTFVSGNQLTAAVTASLIASPGTASLTVQMPGGSLLGPYPFTVNAAAPVISSVNSSTAAIAGGPGVTLRIDGTGFVPADVVLWNGSSLSTTYVSPTQLTAAVPASMLVSAGTVSVTVQSPSGNSNAVSYNVLAPRPTISSLNPASAEAGGSTFTLTINGTGFQNGAYASWGGVRLSCTFISSTQLTASVAGTLIASPGTVTIFVDNPDGQSSGEISFSITGTPTPAIAPNTTPSAIAGGPAFTLSIGGSNFVAGAVIRWNGSPLATTYVSASVLSAAVPAALIASPGTASITVVNPGGKTSNAVTLTILAPRVDYLVDAIAPAGSPAISLKVQGGLFVTGSTVYWNGAALATTWVDNSWLTASVPASLLVTPGTANVTVVNPGNIVSNSVTFTIQAPSITSLTPQSNTAGGPAFTLTVSGGQFYPGSIVQWNGSALPTNYVSSSWLTASVSASLIASPGSASIIVLIPGGATTKAATFTIQPAALTIASLNPPSVAAGGQSFTLTVNGSGFVPGTAISWKPSDSSTTYALNTNYVSPGQVAAIVPGNLFAAPGTASVTVTNPGSASFAAATITITTPTPQISGSYPRSVTAGSPAFVLTVTGTGFLSGATVQWNGTTLTTTYVSATQLTASVPTALTAAPGSASIVVVNPGGTRSSSLTFSIDAAIPAIAALMPISATAGGQQFNLSVFGSGFLPASVVQWNSSPLATSYSSGSQLTAVVPASLIANAGTASVTVVNQGGAVSGASAFTINPAAPSISNLSPSSTAAGGSAFTLVVYGTGYLPGAVVRFDGTRLATTYVSGSQLTAVVPANVILSAGTSHVMVINPGEVDSALAAFTVSPNAAGRLTIATAATLPAGTVGVPYSQAMAATGGYPPYRAWTVVDPNDLPPGISLVAEAGAGSASLTGTSMVTGRFSFSVQVTDSVDATATQQLSLTINTGALSISANGIVNAASYAGGNVAPGEIVTVFGSGFGPETLADLQLDGRGYVGTIVADTQVLFNGVPGAMIYAVAGQVCAVAPYAISGMSSVPVQVIYQGQGSNIVPVSVSKAIPGIFTSDSSGHGQGAILNQDGTPNSPDNPAPVGSVISLYATGEGLTVPDGVDGKPAGYPAPVPFAQPVTATIGGLSAPVQYAGGAPGEVAGVMQVNLQIPQGLSAGNAIPIIIRVGGQDSQANVTIAIK